MVNKTIKKAAKRFIKKYKLMCIDYVSLKNTVVKMGYTIIEFNSLFNDKNIETVIQNLELSEKILKSRGFTYVSSDYRLIFVNEDLTDEEKLLVISHEIGHIICEHFSVVPIIGSDVKEEYEANEFAHYLLHQGTLGKLKKSVIVHRKAFIATIILLCLIASSMTTLSIIRSRIVYEEKFYVTSTGKCYHKKECVFVKNKTNIKKLSKEEFEKRLYSPCEMCLPDRD